MSGTNARKSVARAWWRADSSLLMKIHFESPLAFIDEVARVLARVHGTPAR